MTLMQAELSKENGTLTFTLTTPEYMEKETAEKLKPFLRCSNSLHLEGWEVYPRHFFDVWPPFRGYVLLRFAIV